MSSVNSKTGEGSISPVNLRCEYFKNPIGIDVPSPRFSWMLEGSGRGEYQSAYRIIVASSRENLDEDDGDKWDSGKIDSDRSVNVPYEGATLASGERCYWKVRVWGQDVLAKDSEPAVFETGLLKKSDWEGIWIGAESSVSSPLLRKEFTIEGEIVRARAYISGLGYYELYINGKKVGDHVLDPVTTYYNNDQPFELGARVLYVTYDVTDYLVLGINVVGVILGHGWYSSDDVDPILIGREPYAKSPRLILQMNIEYQNGERLSIVSGEGWKAFPGPITANDICDGEVYDARLERDGWNTPGYDDFAWARGQVVEPPGGVLVSQSLPPSRVIETVEPVEVTQPEKNVYVYDFGQGFSGWVRMRVSGKRGAKVTLKYAGRVYDDGRLDRRSNLGAEQTDTYILRGEDIEVWQPRFTLHGFRYVEVSGFPGEPTLEDLKGCFVRTDAETSGDFTCSNSLINSIHRNVCWTFMTSLQGIPQDAGERDERVAWLGDTGFVVEDYFYNYDTASFWAKWLNDIKDSQKPNGDVPKVSPLHWRGGILDDLNFDPYLLWPAWKATYPLLIWGLYLHYEDVRVLEEHYDSLKKLADFLVGKAEGDIITEGLGDHMEPQADGVSHFTPNHTPPSLTSTAYHFYNTWITSQVAEILGKSEDAEYYSDQANKIKNSFNREFFDENANNYATGSQTSNALPLYLGLVPEGREEAVLKNLVDDIMITNHKHLSTGIIGTDALENVLPKYGRADVMYELATQTTLPSWGYGVVNGATTLWETWEGDRELSLNMKMFGSTEKFFYKDLAGIGPAAPGFRRIMIKPNVVGDLKHVRASVMTVRGRVTVHWEKSDEIFEMKVIIPINTSAEINIPKVGWQEVDVSEGGVDLWKDGRFVEGVPGITDGSESVNYLTFAAGSGSYSFRLTGE